MDERKVMQIRFVEIGRRIERERDGVKPTHTKKLKEIVKHGLMRSFSQ